MFFLFFFVKNTKSDNISVSVSVNVWQLARFPLYYAMTMCPQPKSPGCSVPWTSRP
jgi:hypothetical protein